MARGGGGLLFVLCLLFGLYFLNIGFNFVKIPELAPTLNKWVTVAGGVLLIFSSFKFLTGSRAQYTR